MVATAEIPAGADSGQPGERASKQTAKGSGSGSTGAPTPTCCLLLAPAVTLGTAQEEATHSKTPGGKSRTAEERDAIISRLLEEREQRREGSTSAASSAQSSRAPEQVPQSRTEQQQQRAGSQKPPTPQGRVSTRRSATPRGTRPAADRTTAAPATGSAAATSTRRASSATRERPAVSSSSGEFSFSKRKQSSKYVKSREEALLEHKVKAQGDAIAQG